MEKHQPVIFTDGGPWAEHDVLCYVCRNKAAVLEMNKAIFLPCWNCQTNGWVLKRRSKFWNKVRLMVRRKL